MMHGLRVAPTLLSRFGVVAACLFILMVVSAVAPALAHGDTTTTAGGTTTTLGGTTTTVGEASEPRGLVTRGELAIMLSWALKIWDADASHFNDVTQEDGCLGAVNALYEAGVITGSGEDTFSPNTLVTRQAAVLWVMQSLGYKAAQEGTAAVPYRLSYFDSPDDWLGGFEDRAFISPKCERAVANAVRLGVVEVGSDQRFYPTMPISHDEIAVLLVRAFSRTLRERAVPPATVEARSSYPALRNKSEGLPVWYLEYQLASLKYCPGPVDGVFDYRTRDAVMAFQKVEKLKRNGIAGDAVWKRLLSAQTPAPKLNEPGSRVEVDLTRQVLLMIADNEVWKIVHVSTGANGTRTGHFKIQRKYKGWVECVTLSGRMYYPSYVVSKTAIHGYPSVPSYPASHGCVRVPVWMAKDLWYETPSGTTVDIYRNRG